MNVVHFEIRAACVRREEPTSVLLLVFMLLIEDQHLQQVLTMDQFVF